MTDVSVIELIFFLIGGLALGAAYLVLLRIGTDALLVRRGWARVALFGVVRVGLVAGALWFAALQGPLPLLAVFSGFLVARGIGLARARGA